MKFVSDLHEAARKFAAAGIPVFPCLPGEKTPACAHGFHDATTDISIIDAWWTDEPRLNVAFCPHMAGLAIIDPDGVEGEAAWANWQIEHGELPPTYTVQTPRGGRHLYYRGILPPTQSKLGLHVDTRGVGSYALIPPSVITGYTQRYEVIDPRQPADLPDTVQAFLDKLKKDRVKAASTDLDQPQNVARAARLLRDYVARGHVAIEDHMGDGRTFAVACEVQNFGLSPEKCLELMLDLWNPACKPPWDEDELWVKVENASRYAQNEAGAWAVGDLNEGFQGALDNLPAELRDDRPPPRSKYEAWSLEELDALPEPTWLVDKMIPAVSVSLLYGPGGSYKTFLALNIGLDLAQQGKSVVYLEGEGGIGPRTRSRAWRLVHDCDPTSFRVARHMPTAAEPGTVVEFIEANKKFKPELVIVDTAARMLQGLNENDARDMGQLVASLDAIKFGLNCAVLAIHHTGKDVSRGARGSDALLYATDAAFEVQADEGAKVVAMWCRRFRDAQKPDRPWCYEGRELGGSLVFQSIPYGDYAALTRARDQLKGAVLGGLLREMGAVGFEAAVTTHALAFELVSRADPDLSDDARGELVAKQSRVLGALAKDRLEAYCAGAGQSLVWFVPSA